MVKKYSHLEQANTIVIFINTMEARHLTEWLSQVDKCLRNIISVAYACSSDVTELCNVIRCTDHRMGMLGIAPSMSTLAAVITASSVGNSSSDTLESAMAKCTIHPDMAVNRSIVNHGSIYDYVYSRYREVTSSILDGPELTPDCIDIIVLHMVDTIFETIPDYNDCVISSV
jgi:hypothetical protein